MDRRPSQTQTKSKPSESNEEWPKSKPSVSSDGCPGSKPTRSNEDYPKSKPSGSNDDCSKSKPSRSNEDYPKSKPTRSNEDCSKSKPLRSNEGCPKSKPPTSNEDCPESKPTRLNGDYPTCKPSRINEDCTDSKPLISKDCPDSKPFRSNEDCAKSKPSRSNEGCPKSKPPRSNKDYPKCKPSTLNEDCPYSKPFRSNEDCLWNIRMFIGFKRWDFSAMKHIISLNSSLVNVIEFNCKTILEVMVLDDRGTEDIVRFLIDHGADVNFASGRRLFLDALKCCKERPGIVKALLENGIDIEDDYGGTSALSEAIFEEYKVDVLKMVIDKNVDVNHVNQFGQSPLCRALACGREFEVVKLLLVSGANVSTCECHQTPMHCLASAKPIRTRVVELLLRNGAGGGNIIIDDLERTVLHNALRHSTYEAKAMCVLIRNEIADTNVRDARDSTYLHDALCNPGCRLGVVKCLIEQGAMVNSVDWLGETPLHKALLTRHCNFEIVRYLLKKGSPVNVPNRTGETALVVAVKNRQNLYVIRLLMSSGERVNHPRWESLHIAFHNSVLDRNAESMALFKTLLKYAFLEDHRIDIRSMVMLDRTRSADPNVWVRFWNGCLFEVRKLLVGRTWRSGISLHNILGYGTTPILRNSYESLSDIDNKGILSLLKDAKFPFYTEVLKAKLGHEFLTDAFAAINVRAPYKDDKNEKFSVLTSQCLEHIGNFLSLDEKLSMIFLFSRAIETEIKK